MSERKVLTKYYPPDFDPSAIKRTKKPKDAANKLQTVRLMAPFSMRCSSCGEYIYKGRKFNARKETTDESYYSIKIIRFYLKCTRCSAEITFKTDPKHMDYTCEKGARRNFEPWREAKLNEETEEEMFDRLEREAAEHDPMAELESKALDAKTEMAIADSLDQIRTRNARLERSGKIEDAMPIKDPKAEEQERQDREDEEAARLAFQNAHMSLEEIVMYEGEFEEDEQRQPLEAEEERPASPLKAPASPTKQSQIPVPTFAKTKKTKKDFSAALGIKKKPALV